MHDTRQELLREIEGQAIHFGRFTLSSGATSHYYINCRQVTLSPRGAYLTANAILDALENVETDAIGGMTVAADPIAAAVALESWHRGRPINAFIVRKQAKGHGLQRQVEGPIKPGDRVVVVDDVLTTGGSILQAIETVEGEGATVERVVVLIDRQQGGAERIREKGYKVTSIFTFDDLRAFVEAGQHVPPS